MKPSRFYLKKSLIKRRILISSIFIVACTASLGLGVPSLNYFTGILIVGAVYYAYKLAGGVILLFRNAPAITISDDGVRDSHFGDTLIPWTAITEIKATTPSKVFGRNFGSMVILIAEASDLKTSPGPLAVRFANWVRGARPGVENKQLALPMTVTIALEATLDDLLEAIRAHTPVPIQIQHVG